MSLIAVSRQHKLMSKRNVENIWRLVWHTSISSAILIGFSNAFHVFSMESPIQRTKIKTKQSLSHLCTLACHWKKYIHISSTHANRFLYQTMSTLNFDSLWDLAWACGSNISLFFYFPVDVGAELNCPMLDVHSQGCVLNASLLGQENISFQIH